jgi:drug/metabolite transporter (DMT)-like permease
MTAQSLRLGAWLGAAALSLGVVPLAKKMALVDGGSTAAVAVGTSVIAGLVIATWLGLQGQWNDLKTLSRRDWRSVLAVGALGSGLVPLFGILAMTETSASNRALFQSAYPVATALAARTLLNERLDPPAYLWIALICLGLVLMNVETGNGLGLTSWPFWLLASTLPLVGLADVLAKRSLGSATPEIIAFGRALGGLLILTFLLPWVGWSPIAAMDADTWLWVLLAGVCMGIFAVSLYQVFDRTLATLAASLIALAPVLTLVLEVSLLDLRLDSLQWVSFALVLSAVILLSRRV